jgi:hypothetical protein
MVGYLLLEATPFEECGTRNVWAGVSRSAEASLCPALAPISGRSVV